MTIWQLADVSFSQCVCKNEDLVKRGMPGILESLDWWGFPCQYDFALCSNKFYSYEFNFDYEYFIV